GTSFLAEHVAHAAHRLDEARLAVLLGLAAQITDEDLEGVGPRAAFVAPDPVDDDAVRQHLTWVLEEQFEQGELRLGELQKSLAAAGFVRDRIEREVAEAKNVTFGGQAPQESTEAGEQLRERERLDQIVVGAGIETLDPFGYRVLGGENQNGRGIGNCPQPAANLEAVHLGHADVEHERVRWRGDDLVQGLPS